MQGSHLTPSAPCIGPHPSTLDIRVITNARRNEVGESRGGRLVIRTTAAPVDDRANIAVCRILAGNLGVRRRDVEIITGHRSRNKTIRIRR